MEKCAELFGSTYRRGEIVFRQGDPGNVMYIIQSGAVEVSQQKNGNETVIAILEKGDFFGEMALLQNEFRSATVRAISRTRLIPLTEELLIDRLKRDSDVSMHLLKKLIQRIRRAHGRYRKELKENEAFRNAVARHTYNAPVSDEEMAVSEHRGRQTDSRVFTENFLLSYLKENRDSHRQDIDPGEIIFREGETGSTMYFILSGTLCVSKGEAAAARTIDTIGPGDFFGEMALISDMPRSATVTALESTAVIAINKHHFTESLNNEPALAIAIIQTMIVRLTCLEKMLSDPGSFRYQHRPPWLPILKKRDRISLSIVSLSTCAGCSAVMLDRSVLSEMLSMTSINFCRMLMDEDNLPESEVILVDGVVRMKEDERKLAEARRRCRHLVAWGTCATFSGIPGLANRFEVETVIEESYGTTNDTFSYYFSGATGVDSSNTYQLNGIELQRRAFAIDSFVKVDYYLPGCPPSPLILLNLLSELTEGRSRETPPIVCSRCGRKLRKNTKDKMPEKTDAAAGSDCFNSIGKICLGFMTRGGCDSLCPKNGVPCWGCRGPSKKAIVDIQAGDTLEDIATKGFGKRSTEKAVNFREAITRIKQTGHFMFNIDREAAEKLLRMK